MRLRAEGTLTEVADGANAWIEETQNAAAIARFRSIMINKEVEGDIVDLFVDRFMTPFVPPRYLVMVVKSCEIFQLFYASHLLWSSHRTRRYNIPGY